MPEHELDLEKLDELMARFPSAVREWASLPEFAEATRALLREWEAESQTILSWDDLRRWFLLFYVEDIVRTAIDRAQAKQAAGEGRPLEEVQTGGVTRISFVTFANELLQAAQEQSPIPPGVGSSSGPVSTHLGPVSRRVVSRREIGEWGRLVPSQVALAAARRLDVAYRKVFEELSRL